MGRKSLLRVLGFAVLGRILHEHGVGIAGHVFVWVHGDKGRTIQCSSRCCRTESVRECMRRGYHLRWFGELRGLSCPPDAGGQWTCWQSPTTRVRRVGLQERGKNGRMRKGRKGRRRPSILSRVRERSSLSSTTSRRKRWCKAAMATASRPQSSQSHGALVLPQPACRDMSSRVTTSAFGVVRLAASCLLFSPKFHPSSRRIANSQNMGFTYVIGNSREVCQISSYLQCHFQSTWRKTNRKVIRFRSGSIWNIWYVQRTYSNVLIFVARIPFGISYLNPAYSNVLMISYAFT